MMLPPVPIDLPTLQCGDTSQYTIKEANITCRYANSLVCRDVHLLDTKSYRETEQTRWWHWKQNKQVGSKTLSYAAAGNVP